jgi:hypothetical protein
MPTDRVTVMIVRLVLFLEVAVVTVTLSVGVALAINRGTASAAQAVGSATWGSVFVPKGATASSGSLSVNWSLMTTTRYTMIDLVNTSSLALSGQTISVVTVRNNGGNQSLPSITFRLCRGGTWNTTSNTCSGMSVNLGSTTSGSIVVNEPVAIGERLAIRATVSGSNGSAFTTTFSSQVTRTQVRAGTVVNQ